ncbi:DUF3888 domain-containing protein [Neobacillus sp. LXY-1]|uniref:DUF3888 domain-containing protein n=1 Tax=Neobacillus sp. LXY-1 TaxID=3379133 RepID=UPI003EDF1A67
MKKYLCVGLIVGMLALGNSTFTANAKGSKGKEPSNNFMLSLLSKDIQLAVSNYYKEENVSVGSPDSIFIKYGHDDNKGVVEIFQSEKGHELPNSYVVKVNITPQKKGMLGRDTITFGIEPENQQDKGIEINMLDYKHIAISKK